MQNSADLVPEWEISKWFNTATPISIASLRGRVVMIEAFQMLCPGCVAHGLPQAKRAAGIFAEKDVAVIGLHSVFEHHDAQGPVSLKAFLHEYQINFPVGVDQHDDDSTTPLTMSSFELRGTPSLLLIDRSGYLRHHRFGQVDDIELGAFIMELVKEPANSCTDQGCEIETGS